MKGHPANSAQYKYTRPLLGCSVDNATRKAFLQDGPLDQKLTSLVSDLKDSGDADAVSVYYSDLENGHWAGVDEDTDYVPASMFKVPTMMAWYRIAQEDQTVLQKSVQVVSKPEALVGQEIPATKSIVDGHAYTVDDLIDYMIKYSDNRATETLNQLESQAFSGSYVDTVTDLGIEPPKSGKEFQVSPRDYSIFLRVLYNATYLDAGMSEKALGLLAQTDFDQGIRAGVPKDVPVAHKFGEYADTTKPAITERQLHDCGIVYAPKGAYTLCVMTRGKTVAGLEHAISSVSQAVYDAVGKK